MTHKASADKFATRCLGNLQSLPIIFDVFVIHTRDAIKRDFSRSFTIHQIEKRSRSKEGEQKLFSVSKRLTIKRYSEKGHIAFRDLNQTAWVEWELIFIAKSACNLNLINAFTGNWNVLFDDIPATAHTKGWNFIKFQFYVKLLSLTACNKNLTTGCPGMKCQLQNEWNLKKSHLRSISVSHCFYLLTASENN